MTRREQTYLAGIYLFETSDFEIPPKSIGQHVDISCLYKYHSIAPFAFRTHAHARGRSISAYRIRKDEWYLIGQGNPQEPQAFFPIENRKKAIIHRGDHVVARCTFDSNSSKVIYPGSYSQDEMCNFYMMYYTKPEYIDDIPEGCHRVKTGLKFPKGSDKVVTNFPPTTITNMVTTTVSTKPQPPPFRSTTLAQTILKSTPTSTKVKGPFPVVDNDWNVKRDKLGQISGVAMDANDNVVLFHRGNHVWDSNAFDDDNVYLSTKPISTEAILKVDSKTGHVIKSFGKDFFYLPHGLTIDDKGNYWLTDVGMHQVFKFSGDKFELLLTLGQKFQPGSSDYHFCKPTDVAVEKNGNFFVADGYCNSRIAKFSPTGTLIKQWGKINQGNSIPDAGEFDIPHSLALDHKRHHLYIADRENARIQIYTTDGTFVRLIQHEAFGMQLFAIAFNPNYNGVLYAVNGEPNDNTVGFTIKAKTGEVINTWKPSKNLQQPHAIAVSKNNNEVFVAQIGPNKLWKFNVNHPVEFPWKPITKHDPVVAHVSSVKNVSPIDEEEPSDDETLVPALIVVIVLAFPLILIIIGVVVQHAHFKRKRNKAVRKLRSNPLNSRDKETCFGCCITREYNPYGDRAFDQLIKGEIVVDEEDDELFSRKA